jgi:hypothetical protein
MASHLKRTQREKEALREALKVKESDDWTPGYRPSNGTEGHIFSAQWCSNCTIDHDGGWHVPDADGGDSCPILMDALAGEHSYPNPEGPPQWQDRGGYGRGHETRCTEFQGPCSCPHARDPYTGAYVRGGP